MTGRLSHAPSHWGYHRLPNHYYFQENVTFPGCPSKPEVPAWSGGPLWSDCARHTSTANWNMSSF